MNSRSSPGMSQWVVVTIIVTGVVFLLYKVYQYGSFRQYFPAGLHVAGVDVGGLDRDQAAEALLSRYDSDVVLYYGDESVTITPSRDAEFQLDLDTMLTEADFQRSQQDYWAGFWGYLWNRPMEVEMVELRATHDPEVLRRTLETVAGSFDSQPHPPQPLQTTLSFEYGEPGVEMDLDASIHEVEAALYRPTGREAHLTRRRVQAERPDIGLLARLIVNYLQDQRFDGVASIFIMDLNTGEEVRIESDMAMSGVDLLKLPLVVDAYRFIDTTPSLTQREYITQTLVGTEADGPNALLAVIAGQDNPYTGANLLTESLWRLGLKNTFMAVPYDLAPAGARSTYETPANSSPDILTDPDPGIQTTAEDMGALLAMVYYCAQNGGGALRAVYPDAISQQECQQIIEGMKQNRIGSLIEEGVPAGTPIAHRHGWVGDTHADAGIVFSPGGDYILVEMLYHEDWLPWEQSSPLMADIARATYNYFNFDNPYLQTSRVN